MKVFYVETDRLLPGMITVEDVLSENSGVIIPAKTFLNTKLITKLHLHNISQVPVVIPAAVSECMNKADVSHLNKIRSSTDFKIFQKKYNDIIVKLKTDLMAISDARETPYPYDFDELTGKIEDLASGTYCATHIFDLLHCIRDFDDSTFVHSLNVSLICHAIGIWLQFPEEDQHLLTMSGILHDIGKLRVPYELIVKPTKLTDEEYAIIKKHTQYGYDILSRYDIDSRVKDTALMHHERIDGSGYPHNLTGKSIGTYSKIVAIADVYDAMTALRTYRDSISPFEVVATLERDGFSKYEPAYLLPFLTRIAQAYIGVPILLSNSLVGEVIMINPQNLSRPIIKVGSEFLDLTKERDINIKALI